MKPSSYLGKTKSHGKTYIYIRRNFRPLEDKSKVRKENLYSFGAMPGALEKMYSWRENPDLLPKELIDLGCDMDDLREWILTLETQITKNGKPFKL